MCLHERYIENPRYKPNKKNGGRWPIAADPRLRMIPIECGECIECRKKKAREWQVRMLEDIKHNTNGIFVTLTFSNISISKLAKDKKIKGFTGYEKDNAIAATAVRKFTNRWRKINGKSLRHWLITELGHEGTENIHLHGIIFTNEPKETIRKKWKYGWCWIGEEQPDGSLENYVTEKTVNYCVKYIYKRDPKHKYYKPKMLTSPGMGADYIKTHNATKNKYISGKTKESYTTRTGHQISLPKYWRNKIYSEDEREKLWIEKLDKNIKYINGIAIDISVDRIAYEKILKRERKANKQMGYGDGTIIWEQKEFENKKRQEMINKRIKKQLDAELTDALILPREAEF